MNQLFCRPATAALFLILTVVSMGCSSNAAPPVAEDFATMDQGVLQSVVAEQQGKPVIMILWATWCPSCKEAMPQLEKLSRERSDVQVLAVSVDDSKDALVSYFSDGLPHMKVFLAADDIGQLFNVQYIPHMVVFDGQGTVVLSRTGVFPYEMLNTMADQLVAK